MADNNEFDLPAGYGTPSGSLSKYETWKLKNTKDGEVDELCLRVLPLMKSMVAKDDFGLYWALHFGWNGINAKDPAKKAFHPFLCIEEKNYGMVTVECPVCKYRATYLDKVKAAEADMERQTNELIARGQAKGVAKPEIDKAVARLREKLVGEIKPLRDWINNHGRDGKFRILCINKQGQFGIFLAPYSVVQQLRAEMKVLRGQTYPGTTKTIEPAGRKGVFFKITRTGRPSPQSDKVVVNRIEREDGAEVKDFHVISNEQLQEAQNRIPDLVELKGQSRIRLDQMEALVQLDKSGGGSSDPVEVDRILEIGKTQDPLSEPEWLSGEPASPPVATNAPIQQPVVTQVVKPAEPPKVEAKAAVVPPTPPTPPPAAPAPTPAATAVNGADLSDEDFDNLFK
jgi:hypothetical protein